MGCQRWNAFTHCRLKTLSQLHLDHNRLVYETAWQLFPVPQFRRGCWYVCIKRSCASRLSQLFGGYTHAASNDKVPTSTVSKYGLLRIRHDTVHSTVAIQHAKVRSGPGVLSVEFRSKWAFNFLPYISCLTLPVPCTPQTFLFFSSPVEWVHAVLCS